MVIQIEAKTMGPAAFTNLKQIKIVAGHEQRILDLKYMRMQGKFNTFTARLTAVDEDRDFIRSCNGYVVHITFLLCAGMYDVHMTIDDNGVVHTVERNDIRITMSRR